jgi:Rha family phage regulatory protein
MSKAKPQPKPALPSPFNPAICVEFLPGERPAVRSVDLAQHFGIKHCHVLRDIETLRKKLPASFTESNFGLSDYQDPTGRTLSCFLLTRDAFTLLVMGWNSARAIEWKLKYIEAFNALERAALENAHRAGLEAGARGVLAAQPSTLERMRKVVRYKAMKLSHQEAAKLLDCSTGSITHALVLARKLGLAEGA